MITGQHPFSSKKHVPSTSDCFIDNAVQKFKMIHDSRLYIKLTVIDEIHDCISY